MSVVSVVDLIDCLGELREGINSQSCDHTHCAGLTEVGSGTREEGEVQELMSQGKA